MPPTLTENLSPAEAEARLPLYRSIARELQDRVRELQDLARSEAVNVRHAAGSIRERLRECVVELEVLGAEVEGFRPVTLLVPVRETSGQEQFLSWQFDEACFSAAD